ncbi:hypothetical protein [Streptomyces olivochromogenes]|uniref:hypothetical protein n=1 Tax=Streptomyces olivochromogenes TaxID=1963 RepID=UPI001F435DD0|nr:hypothetical protein [Streptomyces olivochromogenes]MCF3135058.1 hypothetical protein [Streptomyces olivochromogenes]
MGNDKRTVTEPVTECIGGTAQCAFMPEADCSCAYSAPARQADEGYINGTRATIDRERPLKNTARTISDLPSPAGERDPGKTMWCEFVARRGAGRLGGKSINP